MRIESMLQMFSRRKPALVSSHIDAPQSDTIIERPQLEIRGWLAFDLPFPKSELKITLRNSGYQSRLSIRSRPDVSAVFPDLHCWGFDHFLDLNELNPIEADLTLEIRHPGGTESIQLTLNLSPVVFEKSSYFLLNPREHAACSESGISREQQDFWDQNGYLVIPGFFSEDQIAEINDHIDQLWRHREEINDPITIDEYIGTHQKKRVLFNQVSESIREQPYKLNDLYLLSPRIRDAVLNPRISGILSTLMYGGDPLICSSLYFERGSQQEKHFDTFFMPPLIRNRMLATWIALEDVTRDSGPLMYYPGSHHIEPFRFENGRFNLNRSQKPDCYRYIESELEKRRIEPKSLLAHRGDLFIWHAQLLHGGNAINNPEVTRRSLVTHYFCRQDHNPNECEEFSPGMYYLKREYLRPGLFDEESHQYV